MKMSDMNRRIVALALPSIVSNITVPLLGLMDVAIVGHLGRASYIGAIAVGGMLFSMIYWGFGFLRMGTSGLTSQALGRRNLEEVMTQFLRAQGVAQAIALLLLLLQWPLETLVFHFVDASPEVRHWAGVYFRICIWGAPAVLGLYALTGWFIGMQNSRFPMFVAIFQNVVNIVFSLFFVYALDWGVHGVAGGTLLAQWSGFLLSFWLCFHFYRRLWRKASFRSVWKWQEMKHFFTVNREIFGRTVCLIAVTVFFTSSGARQGDTVLAVNTLLMQLFTLFSYIMDGFAYAGEALSGRYLGARNGEGLRRAVRLVFRWGWGLAALFTLLYAVGGSAFLSLLTDEASVLQAAEGYFYWVLLVPVCGFAAFLWDGIFTGMTATRQMLVAMLAACAAFFSLFYLLFPVMGNAALWLSFLVYLALRGLGMWTYWARSRQWRSPDLESGSADCACGKQ